jgi:hypothetical protein
MNEVNDLSDKYATHISSFVTNAITSQGNTMDYDKMLATLADAKQLNMFIDPKIADRFIAFLKALKILSNGSITPEFVQYIIHANSSVDKNGKQRLKSMYKKNIEVAMSHGDVMPTLLSILNRTDFTDPNINKVVKTIITKTASKY